MQAARLAMATHWQSAPEPENYKKVGRKSGAKLPKTSTKYENVNYPR
jgi:hypothetical protein